MISGSKQETDFRVNSDLSQIPVATNKLFDFFSDLNLSESDRFDIRLCFEEMLINAMKHGNGLSPDLDVTVRAAYEGSRIFITIIDQGPGFEVEKVKDPTICENLEANGGRGVFLVKHLMDSMNYLDNGTRVEMVKTVQVNNAS